MSALAGTMLKDQNSIISGAKILRMHYLYFGDNQCVMCRGLLLNKVFENGITLCSGPDKKSCKELKMTNSDMDNVWIPLAKDIVDIVMILGVVPVRFDNGIPYVPKPGTYDIHVKTTNIGTTSYELHDKDNPIDPVPNSFVFSGYGYDPRVNGSLISMIKTLEPTMQFIHRMSDAALMAEETSCNPPIIVERKEKGTDAREGLEFDFYMDADTLKSSLNSQYQRDEKAVKQLQNQRLLFAAAINGSESSKKNTTTAMDNVVPLPNEYHVGSVIEPSGRNDYVMICRMASETICSTLGVPRSMLISDNVVRGDIEGSHDVFKQSCLKWKRIVSNILTLVYRHVHKSEEAERLTKLSKKRKLKDISKLANTEMVEIVVPVTPYISNEELKDMYLYQIIDWKTYREYVLRNASLPLDNQKFGNKDPWSKDDKKELLGIAQKPDPLSQAGGSSSGKGKMKAGDKSNNKKIAKNK